MPRPKKPGAGEPKKRSRNGCWPCKARKVKCGEEKPRCSNCERQGETCDYSIKLNWGGRAKRTPDKPTSGTSSATASPYQSSFSFDETVSPLFPPTPTTADTPATRPEFMHHARSHSALSAPTSDAPMIDPDLMRTSQNQSPMMRRFADDQATQCGRPQSARQNSPYPAPTLADFKSHNAQYHGGFDYPSPTVSSFDTQNPGSAVYAPTTTDSPLSPPSMLPPIRNAFYSPGYRPLGDVTESMYSHHKRSHSAESPANSTSYSPLPGPSTPFNSFTLPLTPNSSAAPEEYTSRPAMNQSTIANPPTDLRRLSVQSLLAGPPGDYLQEPAHDLHQVRRYPIGDADYTIHGYDLGNPDLDTPKNDDYNAISVLSPPSNTIDLDDEKPYGSTETRGQDMAFEKGGYYNKPVPIKISNSLGPLPPILRENPMNLLYFHHFLNHTARILVPHDCEQNPFRQVLPEMAIHDENIMHLLLAFSASHRARLLKHPEPANRIAMWVQHVFPRLRLALDNGEAQISNATLASAIMMASLEIISPNTFEVPISWQNHLTMARQMIMIRGGPQSVDRHDHVAYFLSRWFAYLDVLGSLSGNNNDQPLRYVYWSSDTASSDEGFQIDCLMGFTKRCISSLAQIAELAKRCEAQRIDAYGNIRADWVPPQYIVEQAAAIRHNIEEGLSDRVAYKGCNHRSQNTSEGEGVWDATEIHATNEMFHWAGLIHLFRRVLGKPSGDPEVQHAVRMIVGLLYKVRKGSTAEACLLFPMFSAGCDAQEQGQREVIMERLRCVEGFGMTQIHRARSLMQRVWDTGRPWETLVSGEFFG